MKYFLLYSIIVEIDVIWKLLPVKTNTGQLNDYDFFFFFFFYWTFK